MFCLGMASDYCRGSLVSVFVKTEEAPKITEIQTYSPAFRKKDLKKRTIRSRWCTCIKTTVRRSEFKIKILKLTASASHFVCVDV